MNFIPPIDDDCEVPSCLHKGYRCIDHTETSLGPAMFGFLCAKHLKRYDDMKEVIFI